MLDIFNKEKVDTLKLSVCRPLFNFKKRSLACQWCQSSHNIKCSYKQVKSRSIINKLTFVIMLWYNRDKTFCFMPYFFLPDIAILKELKDLWSCSSKICSSLNFLAPLLCSNDTIMLYIFFLFTCKSKRLICKTMRHGFIWKMELINKPS